MPAISESFLHFLWREKLYHASCLITDDGRKIEVLNPGMPNNDAGPDFVDARIRIGDVFWAGNVEIHLRASDWMEHGHFEDPAYDNVILHVVGDNDQQVFLGTGDILPAVELSWDKKLEENYSMLLNSRSWVACQPYLHRLDPFRIKFFLGNVVVERLERFTAEIEEEMLRTHNNWEEVFYRFLARGFGIRVNAQPFLLLARSLPLSYVAKHRDNLPLLEAMFFGQAGWLQEDLFGDTYYESLKKDYAFLRQKFSLQPLPAHIWKLMRMRPSAFPTIRLAQFIRLLHQRIHLFSDVMNATKVDDLRKIFDLKAEGYWETHYFFNKPAKKQVKTFGIQAFRTLLINVVIPFYFVYGKRIQKDELKEKAVDLLESLPPEKNRITRKWEESGIRAESAFYSQALVQLKNAYCNTGRCGECGIGKNLIINS